MRLLTFSPRRLTGAAAIACAAALIPVASLAATASPAAPAGTVVPRCLQANLATGLHGYESDYYDGGHGLRFGCLLNRID